MAIIGIAGLPGSGKSRLMDELHRHGYRRFNDINRDWEANVAEARQAAQKGEDIAISDIMFCDESWRRTLEKELGLSVRWIYFANDAAQCIRNCEYRFTFEKQHRPLEDEIRMIHELAPIYRPFGDVRPVARTDKGE